ncbi:hypothetical protein QUB08_14990 [Microcoleus sp. BR0-C5]
MANASENGGECILVSFCSKDSVIRKKEEGRRKKEEEIRKKEEGRRKKK